MKFVERFSHVLIQEQSVFLPEFCVINCTPVWCFFVNKSLCRHICTGCCISGTIEAWMLSCRDVNGWFRDHDSSYLKFKIKKIKFLFFIINLNKIGTFSWSQMLGWGKLGIVMAAAACSSVFVIKGFSCHVGRWMLLFLMTYSSFNNLFLLCSQEVIWFLLNLFFVNDPHAINQSLNTI